MLLLDSPIQHSFAYANVLEDADNSSCTSGVVDEVFFFLIFSLLELGTNIFCLFVSMKVKIFT